MTERHLRYWQEVDLVAADGGSPVSGLLSRVQSAPSALASRRRQYGPAAKPIRELASAGSVSREQLVNLVGSSGLRWASLFLDGLRRANSHQSRSFERGPALQEIMPEPLRTASLGESPPTRYRVPKRTRNERQMVMDSPDADDDAPSAYQRRALSSASDVDGNAQPSYLGRHEHPAPFDEDDDGQPTLLGTLFGALFPW